MPVQKGKHFVMRDENNNTFGMGTIKQYKPAPLPHEVFNERQASKESSLKQMLDSREEYARSELRRNLLKTFKTLKQHMKAESEIDKDEQLKQGLSKMKEDQNNFIASLWRSIM